MASTRHICLGIDYGSSNTVAAIRIENRPAQVLIFDGSPQLPSAVFAETSGDLLTGRDAVCEARTAPQRFDLAPKRRIGGSDATLRLGEREYPLRDVVAATLARVAAEATRVAGAKPDQVVLTCPAAWGDDRKAILLAGAEAAGLPVPNLVAEPVAAAAYFVDVLEASLATDGIVVIYDFGAGTFDATVVRRTAAGFTALATEGLPDTGGLDIDAAIVDRLIEVTVHDQQYRTRLREPSDPGDRRARTLLWEDARSAKEMLSRTPSTIVHVPLVEIDAPLGREEFEGLARPLLERTVEATRRAIETAGVEPGAVGGIFLVGGSSRVPLAATLLHRAFSIAPTALDRPEMVVAEGAVLLASQHAQATGDTGTGTASAQGQPAGGPVTPVLTASQWSTPAQSRWPAAPPQDGVGWTDPNWSSQQQRAHGQQQRPAQSGQPAPHRPAANASQPSPQSSPPQSSPPLSSSPPYQTPQYQTPQHQSAYRQNAASARVPAVPAGAPVDRYQQVARPIPRPAATQTPVAAPEHSTVYSPASRRRTRRGIVALGVVVVLGFAAIRWGSSAWSLVEQRVNPTPSASGQRFPAAAVGSWSGNLEQSNGSRWQMQLTVPKNGTAASVSYPQLGCSGTVTLRSANGGTLVAAEQITKYESGRNCTASGDMTMHLAGSDMTIEYRPTTGASYTANAKLTKAAG